MERLILLLITVFVTVSGITAARNNPGVGTLGETSSTSSGNRSSNVFYRGGFSNGRWVSEPTRRTSSSFAGRGPGSGVK